MSPSPNASSSQNHLAALALFHWIFAGMLVVMSLVMVLHAVDLIQRVTAEQRQLNEPLPGAEQAMTLYGIVVGLFVLTTLLLAALIGQTGRWLKLRRRYNMCLIVAGVECLLFPMGTILGVFAFIVLFQAQTREIFEAAQSNPQEPG